MDVQHALRQCRSASTEVAVYRYVPIHSSLPSRFGVESQCQRGWSDWQLDSESRVGEVSDDQFGDKQRSNRHAKRTARLLRNVRQEHSERKAGTLCVDQLFGVRPGIQLPVWSELSAFARTLDDVYERRTQVTYAFDLHKGQLERDADAHLDEASRSQHQLWILK